MVLYTCQEDKETETAPKRVRKTETKKFEKISKKVLTNYRLCGIISMSGKGNGNQAKASLETETKKHLTSKTKYGIMNIPKEKRGKNLNENCSI